MKLHHRSFIFVLFAALLACTHAAPRPDSPSVMTKVELYFGLSRAGMPDISERDWRIYSQSIVSCFPNGFTVSDGSGFWRGDDGKLIGEGSRIVTAVYEMDSSLRVCIDTLKSNYKSDFSQEAVLEVDSIVERRL